MASTSPLELAPWVPIGPETLVADEPLTTRPTRTEGLAVNDLFYRWKAWIAAAVIIQMVIVLPYMGDTITVRYGLAEVISVLFSQVVLVGGCMFRAGQLFDRDRVAR